MGNESTFSAYLLLLVFESFDEDVVHRLYGVAKEQPHHVPGEIIVKRRDQAFVLGRAPNPTAAMINMP